MMKIGYCKRLFTALLALVMVFSLVSGSVTVFASDEATEHVVSVDAGTSDSALILASEPNLLLSSLVGSTSRSANPLDYSTSTGNNDLDYAFRTNSFIYRSSVPVFKVWKLNGANDGSFVELYSGDEKVKEVSALMGGVPAVGIDRIVIHTNKSQMYMYLVDNATDTEVSYGVYSVNESEFELNVNPDSNYTYGFAFVDSVNSRTTDVLFGVPSSFSVDDKFAVTWTLTESLQGMSIYADDCDNMWGGCFALDADLAALNADVYAVEGDLSFIENWKWNWINGQQGTGFVADGVSSGDINFAAPPVGTTGTAVLTVRSCRDNLVYADYVWTPNDREVYTTLIGHVMLTLPTDEVDEPFGEVGEGEIMPVDPEPVVTRGEVVEKVTKAALTRALGSVGLLGASGSYFQVNGGQILFYKVQDSNDPHWRYKTTYNGGTINSSGSNNPLPAITLHRITDSGHNLIEYCYCIQPWKSSPTDMSQTKYNLSDLQAFSSLPATQKELVILALCYGANATSGSDVERYATQCMIFDIVFGFVNRNGSGQIVNVQCASYEGNPSRDAVYTATGWWGSNTYKRFWASTVDGFYANGLDSWTTDGAMGHKSASYDTYGNGAAVKAEYDALLARMNNAKVGSIAKPVFSTFELTKQSNGRYEATLSAANASNFNFNWSNGDAIIVTQNGNSVTVSLSESEALNYVTEHELSQPFYSRNSVVTLPAADGGSLHGWTPTDGGVSQSFVSYVGGRPSSQYAITRIKLHLSKSPVSIEKVVPQATLNLLAQMGKDYSVQGATYGVYATEADARNNTNCLEVLTIGANNKATGTELYEPSTTLYIKELIGPTSGNWEVDTRIHTYQGGSISPALTERPYVWPPITKICEPSMVGEVIAGDPRWSLADAKYGLYASESDANADRNRLTTLTTNASGKAVSNYRVTIGTTYYLKEVEPSKGYLLDERVHTVKFSYNESTGVLTYSLSPALTETPKTGKLPIQIHKVSAKPDVTDNDTSGYFSLKNAVYGVYTTYAAAAAATNTNRGSYEELLTTDENGYAEGNIQHRAGTVRYVKELIASPGYQLDERVHTVTWVAISDDGELAGLMFNWAGTSYTMMPGENGTATGLTWTCDDDGNFTMTFTNTTQYMLRFSGGTIENGHVNAIGGGGGGQSGYTGHGGNGGQGGSRVNQDYNIPMETDLAVVVGTGGTGGAGSGSSWNRAFNVRPGTNGTATKFGTVTAAGGAAGGGGAGASGTGAGGTGTHVGDGGGGGSVDIFHETDWGNINTYSGSCFVCGANWGSNWQGYDAYPSTNWFEPAYNPGNVSGGAGREGGGNGGRPGNDHKALRSDASHSYPTNGGNATAAGGGGGGGAWGTVVYSLFHAPNSGTGSREYAGYASSGGGGGLGGLTVTGKMNATLNVELQVDKAFTEEPDGVPPEMNKITTPGFENRVTGNPCYSLAGARYGIYTDKSAAVAAKNDAVGNVQEILVTNAQGKAVGSQICFFGKTYYLKELKPSPGYERDTNVYAFTINVDHTMNVTDIYDGNGNRISAGANRMKFPEMPGGDPGNIEIVKRAAVGSDNEHTVVSGEAIFKVSYYPNENYSGNPTRVWYYTTRNGSFMMRDETLLLHTAPYVSSDVWRNVDGLFEIPAGSIKIQEVQAPPGYYLSNVVLKAKMTWDEVQPNVWAVRRHWDGYEIDSSVSTLGDPAGSGDSRVVQTPDGSARFDEVEVPGQIEVTKFDSQGNKVAGATFALLYSVKNANGTWSDWAPVQYRDVDTQGLLSGTCSTRGLNANGELTTTASQNPVVFTGLVVGRVDKNGRIVEETIKYRVVETAAPKTGDGGILYQLLTEPAWTGVLPNPNSSTGVSVKVIHVYDGRVELPATGGIGTGFVPLALAVGMVSVVGLFFMTRKKKEEQE